MDVILFENVQDLGARGSVVSVSPGHFRNFLSPRGLAVEATKANVRRWRSKVESLERLAEEERNAARTEAEKLDGVELTFRLKSGEGDRLFGSVTPAHIRDSLAELGFEIDRRHIVTGEPIKRLGEYTIAVKFHHDVSAKVRVTVEKDEDEAAKAQAAKDDAPDEEKAEAPAETDATTEEQAEPDATDDTPAEDAPEQPDEPKED